MTISYSMLSDHILERMNQTPPHIFTVDIVQLLKEHKQIDYYSLDHKRKHRCRSSVIGMLRFMIKKKIIALNGPWKGGKHKLVYHVLSPENLKELSQGKRFPYMRLQRIPV